MNHDRFNELLAVEGADLVIEVNRTEDVRTPDRTLSQEAFEMLRDSMTLWVGTRMSRAMARGHMPQKVAVHVFVSLDGELAQ